MLWQWLVTTTLLCRMLSTGKANSNWVCVSRLCFPQGARGGSCMCGDPLCSTFFSVAPSRPGGNSLGAGSDSHTSVRFGAVSRFRGSEENQAAPAGKIFSLLPPPPLRFLNRLPGWGRVNCLLIPWTRGGQLWCTAWKSCWTFNHTFVWQSPTHQVFSSTALVGYKSIPWTQVMQTGGP